MSQVGGLYWEEHGAGPPLLLSSGLGGSGHYWNANLAALAERHRVIRYDHRGTGRSDRALPNRVTVDQLADDMVLLLDALEVERADVIGHAAGGVAGLALALKVPERIGKLIVVNGWASPDPHFLRCFEARLNLLRHAGVAAFLRAQPIFLYPPDWNSTNGATLDAELPQQIADFAGVEAVEKRVAALAGFDIVDRLRDIACPTLVIVADDDMLVPPRAGAALAAGIRNATLARMRGGHACNVTDCDRFNRLVLDFLGS